MMREPSPPPDLTECLVRLRAILAASVEVLNAVIGVTVGNKAAQLMRDEDAPVPEPECVVLPLILQAMCSSTGTILRLSDVMPSMHTRDCYSIARSVVEAAVNVCYIMAVGAPAAERAIRHARAMSFQDLERKSEVGTSVIHSVWSGLAEYHGDEAAKRDIKEFTSRSGRDKGWIDLSIDERIAEAGKRFGGTVLTSLHFARFGVYRHSSEILHGTFYGALYFLGLTEPRSMPGSAETMVQHAGGLHMLILMAVAASLHAVIDSFHYCYGFRAAKEQVTTLRKAQREVPYFNRAAADSAPT